MTPVIQTPAATVRASSSGRRVAGRTVAVVGFLRDFKREAPILGFGIVAALSVLSAVGYLARHDVADPFAQSPAAFAARRDELAADHRRASFMATFCQLSRVEKGAYPWSKDRRCVYCKAPVGLPIDDEFRTAVAPLGGVDAVLRGVTYCE